MSVITDIQQAIRRRKRNRDRKRALKQGRRAQREAGAIRKLRHRLAKAIRAATAPRLQYDSVSVQNIPRDAKAAAFYVDGAFESEAAVKAQAPKARYTSIAVFASGVADCLDIEPGNATIAEAAGWYRKMRELRPKRKPIFYCGAASADELVGALRNSGIKRESYILWTAHYGSGKHFCGEGSCPYARSAGKVDATQFTTNNETLDESTCRPSYWERG